MTINPVESMKASWLGGRGTRVLYAAISVTILGTLLTGNQISVARAEAEKSASSIQQAIALASEVDALCTEYEFRQSHIDTCARATQLLKDPSGGAAGFTVVDALGLLP